MAAQKSVYFLIDNFGNIGYPQKEQRQTPVRINRETTLRQSIQKTVKKVLLLDSK